MPFGQAASRCQHNLRYNTSNACSYMHNIISIPQIPAMFLSICTTTSKRFKVVMNFFALALTNNHGMVPIVTAANCAFQTIFLHVWCKFA